MKNTKKYLLLSLALITALLFSLCLLKSNKHKKNVSQTQTHSISLELITKDKDLLWKIKNRAYFPENIFDSNDDRHNFLATWFGLHLNSMNEYSLWKLKDKREKIIFRFLYLPTFDNPYLITYEINENKFDGKIVLKSTDGLGGFHEGALTINQTYLLNASEIKELLGKLEKFKSIKSVTSKKPLAYGVDGTFWLIEVNKNGDYSINVERFPEQGAVYNICYHLLKLIEAKDQENSSIVQLIEKIEKKEAGK